MQRPRRLPLGTLLALAATACFVDGKDLTTGASQASATTDATATSGEGSTAGASSTSAGESSSTGAPGELKTVIVAVANGSSDALQDPGGSMKVDFGWITLNSPEHYGGLRFAVPVPQGATIVAAELRLYVDGSDTDSPRIEIYGELSPSAGVFSSADYDISARPPTKASVIWSEDDLGMGWHSSASIAPVLQELVDQEGWSSGQHVALILDATNEASGPIPFEFRQSDYSPDFAPLLGIEYYE